MQICCSWSARWTDPAKLKVLIRPKKNLILFFSYSFIWIMHDFYLLCFQNDIECSLLGVDCWRCNCIEWPSKQSLKSKQILTRLDLWSNLPAHTFMFQDLLVVVDEPILNCRSLHCSDASTYTEIQRFFIARSHLVQNVVKCWCVLLWVSPFDPQIAGGPWPPGLETENRSVMQRVPNDEDIPEVVGRYA